ncbi:MAG: hypothetical protein VX133_14675 [Pseudomonadota bacterium]|nr:hypothetical protein [Pseudomonadota bacterium]
MKHLISLTVLATAVMAGSTALATPDMSDYERWRATTQQEFQNYLDETDKAFIGFLKQRWESVDTESGDEEDTAQKPTTIPAAPPAPTPTATPTPTPTPTGDPQNKPLTSSQDDPKGTPVANLQDRPDTAKPESIPETRPKPIQRITGPAADIDFYGHPVRLPYNTAMTRAFSAKPSSESIASAWEALARSDFRPALEQVRSVKASLSLSDWATARLVTDYAHAVARTADSRVMLSWFMLVKLGYDARLAYNNQLYLLIPADDDVYGVTFFTLKGERYYALPLDGEVRIAGQVYTYGKQHETASQPIAFKTPERFTGAGAIQKRRLSYEQDGDAINLVVRYPAEQINYLNSMPQLNLPRYPILDLPASTRAELATQLTPLLQGQSEEVAVNRLLSFVQNAFDYQTDEQQFQTENYLFPLETLHYAASDCEDRAALFALLVHDLLGLPVVLLDYPGHVAAAVAFTGQVKGDSIVYTGRHYTVTDPTYINARAGMTMPQFAGQTPEIVTVF